MKKKKLKKVFISFFIIAMIIAFVVLLLVYHYHHTHYFSTARWVAAKKSERLDMFKNLTYRYEFKGMTKQEIHAILGQPEYSTDKSDTYILGYTFPAVDPYVLKIEYDDTDIATQWDHYES